MDAPKQSLESDHRHLLQSSRPASVYSYATTVVPEQTPTQSTADLPSGGDGAATAAGVSRTTSSPYRGFASKEAYLSALTDFAQERTYFKHDNNLIGFYGKKTMDEYIKEGKTGAGKRSSKRDERAMRRSTLPDLHPVAEGVESGTVREHGGRRNSLAQLGRRVLGRQSSLLQGGCEELPAGHVCVRRDDYQINHI